MLLLLEAPHNVTEQQACQTVGFRPRMLDNPLPFKVFAKVRQQRSELGHV